MLQVLSAVVNFSDEISVFWDFSVSGLKIRNKKFARRCRLH